MLTKKQYELLIYLSQKIKETGIPPSYEEMKEAMGLRSKSGIHRLISSLEERGFLKRLAHKARAIEIVKLPENKNINFSSANSNNFQPNVIDGGLSEASNTNLIDDNFKENIDIPVMGRIAAGVPISAIQEKSDVIAIPTSLLSKGVHYALEISGDSMIDAGILDGDIVVILKTNIAQSGDIIVALIDNEEATLKRLRIKGQSIALEAANPNYETRIFGPDRIKVQGRVVSLYRKY